MGRGLSSHEDELVGPFLLLSEQTGRGVSVNPTGGSPALYLLTAPQPLRSGYLLIGIDGVH